MSESISAFQAFPQLLGTWLTEHAQAVWWYTALVRFLFPILALLVLVRAIRGLLRVPHTPEQWGQLSLPGGGSSPSTTGKISWAAPPPQISASICPPSPASTPPFSGTSPVPGGSRTWALRAAPRSTASRSPSAPPSGWGTPSPGGVDLLFLPLSREEGGNSSPAAAGGGPSAHVALPAVADFVPAAGCPPAGRQCGGVGLPSLFLLFPGLPPSCGPTIWLCAAARPGFEMETIAFFLPPSPWPSPPPPPPPALC